MMKHALLTTALIVTGSLQPVDAQDDVSDRGAVHGERAIASALAETGDFCSCHLDHIVLDGMLSAPQ